ncbi:fumarylacetoacetate hydrolase family protein [Pseudoclavibacter chungangensis]|uniref:Fumarylacetoacetate hydrolase family protein n=1 Tax=Pseudoclavibacter chungangensis TaxID=587635 RepID=A0A7J5BMD3_9MICO|nr:fumarylacetoacetate hydrolase family protein [Pseudoclavibacter chungangensis]KAB1652229.1 fumarylacetoacetate hydrolase family protein [Pseudoclavibacter chungangensis]NYJ67580.1 2-keto-4-pentenoate hydratase/2-oxohepta-3-ene-1,7-dioic acid hydratase in catechol pathway [Pseudoclavibacter chungangensis]
MKIARFEHQGQLTFGILDEETREFVKLAGDPLYLGFETLEERVAVDDVQLLAPVIPRSKVVAFGRNYAEHAREFGNEVPDEPLMFLKPNTSVIGPGHPITLPVQSEQVEHEVELAVVIGSIARNVPREDAAQVIFGYTVSNDVTARDLQRRDGQWSRAKGFDSFCPVGPWIETEFTPTSGAVTCRVNGELRQSGDLNQLERSIGTLVEYASSVFTLLPGDLLLTGTPAGVGPLRAGDVVTCEIEGIGVLENPVVER